MPTTLGIDYGTRRIGMAVSDPDGIVATAVEALECPGERVAAREVRTFCEERGVERVVVGLPLNMDGTDSAMTTQARAFAQRLQGVLSCPVVLWDERMSTQEVDRALIRADVSRAKRRGVRDKLAARVILQSFLDAHADMAGERP